MSFKNALIILTNRFGLVWQLLIYFIVMGALLVGISLPFILPILAALDAEGVFTVASEAYTNLVSGGTFAGFTEALRIAFERAYEVITSDRSIGNLSISFVVVVLVLAFRVFNGFYELPLADVTVNYMSSHVRYGFFTKVIADAGVSARFLLFKVLYTVLFDAVTSIFYLLIIRYVSNILLMLPLLILVLILLMSLRFSLTAMWAVRVVEGGGVVKSFFASVRDCGKNFASVYSNFVVFFIVVIATLLFIGLFTMGVGLLIVIPVSVLFCTCLNNTITFNKTGRRYYLDNAVFTPPASSEALLPTVDDE